MPYRNSTEEMNTGPSEISVPDESSTISLSLDYVNPKNRVGDLYELAKKKTWNASTELDWKNIPTCESFPITEAGNMFSGYTEYEKLTTQEKIQVCWQQHCLELSEILHGEQGALIISSQLVAELPSTEAKLFLSSQVFDEARHMEFFTKYLSEIEGKIYPPSEELSRLLGRTFAENRWVIKMAMCQIVIESLAMAKFQRIRKESKVPLLRYAIDYIIKDEARHVSFGVETLKKHVNQLCSVEKEELANITLESVFELANGFKTYIQIGASYGWDLVDMRRHLRMVQIKKPMLRREIFRQLSLNLEAVGLLTEGAKTLLRERRLV